MKGRLEQAIHFLVHVISEDPLVVYGTRYHQRMQEAIRVSDEAQEAFRSHPSTETLNRWRASALTSFSPPIDEPINRTLVLLGGRFRRPLEPGKLFP